MGSLTSHEDLEPPVVADTPLCRDFSSLDPRSPTLEFIRTPLEVPATHRSRLRRLVSLLDPRSPSQHLNRTPLQRPREPVEPSVEPAVQQLETYIGEIDVAAEVSERSVAEEVTGSFDPKTARALFFGDLTASPMPIPSPCMVPSPLLAQLPVEAAMEHRPEEELMKPEPKEEEEEVAASPEQEQCDPAVEEAECEAAAKESERHAAVTKVMKENVSVAGAELGTPTALHRRIGKENTLKKQLFHTPEKARVRTPLGNVVSFHNSPLRRN